jgi:uncharacterized membrane protein
VSVDSRVAAAGWHRIAVATATALALLECLWELWLAPLRPGGSWLVLKALPLALVLRPLAHGSTRARQYAALLQLPYAAEGVVRGVTESGRHAVVAWAAALLATAVFVALLRTLREDRRPRGR